jgi:hypothetical protein
MQGHVADGSEYAARIRTLARRERTLECAYSDAEVYIHVDRRTHRAHFGILRTVLVHAAIGKRRTSGPAGLRPNAFKSKD